MAYSPEMTANADELSYFRPIMNQWLIIEGVDLLPLGEYESGTMNTAGIACAPDPHKTLGTLHSDGTLRIAIVYLNI